MNDEVVYDIDTEQVFQINEGAKLCGQEDCKESKIVQFQLDETVKLNRLNKKSGAVISLS